MKRKIELWSLKDDGKTLVRRNKNLRVVWDVHRIEDGLGTKVRFPEDIASWSAKVYRALQKDGIIPVDRECFFAVYLDNKNRTLGVSIISIGTRNASLVDPVDVLRPAIVLGAKALVIAHHHPAGDPSPSKEDAEITTRLEKSAKILGIEVLDHVILGWKTFYSVKVGSTRALRENPYPELPPASGASLIREPGCPCPKCQGLKENPVEYSLDALWGRGVRDFLTDESVKTVKGEKYGWLTKVLYLWPWGDVVSGVNLCEHAGACAHLCLFDSGQLGTAARAQINRALSLAGMGGEKKKLTGQPLREWLRGYFPLLKEKEATQEGVTMLRRKLLLVQHPSAFYLLLNRAIESARNEAKRKGMRLAIRLNGTSDLPWEHKEMVLPSWGSEARKSFGENLTIPGIGVRFFRKHPDIQFYDYTKDRARVLRGTGARNYFLTYSYSEKDSPRTLPSVLRKTNVAVVFDLTPDQKEKVGFPPTWSPSPKGEPRVVLDGDKHDLTFLRPPGVIIGLTAKGCAYSGGKWGQVPILRRAQEKFVIQRPFPLGRGKTWDPASDGPPPAWAVKFRERWLKQHRLFSRENPELMILGNPVPSEELAEERFRRFHGTRPKKREVDVEGEDFLIEIGTLKEVVYHPEHGIRSDAEWFHKFRGSTLAASVDGQRLYILPKKGGKPLRFDPDMGIIGG